MTIGGLLSDGIRLGHRTGFDSGSTLDYVYRNTPSGPRSARPPDRQVYLQSIGWRGIRQRKLHLRGAAARGDGAAGATRACRCASLDIAAGHGRYVLDALDASAIRPESVLLRDYSDINVEAGRSLIAGKGLEAIAQFVKGDAFDQAEPRRGPSRSRRSASSPASTSCFPTTAWCRDRSRGSPRQSRPAGT